MRLFWVFSGVLILLTGALAQATAGDWFPLRAGNQWVYEHEIRDTPRENPPITRWTTTETITGTATVPEGIVVLRRVEVRDVRGADVPSGWLFTEYGAANYLIRENCLYFLLRQEWSDARNQLAVDYRERLQS